MHIESEILQRSDIKKQNKSGRDKSGIRTAAGTGRFLKGSQKLGGHRRRRTVGIGGHYRVVGISDNTFSQTVSIESPHFDKGAHYQRFTLCLKQFPRGCEPVAQQDDSGCH